MFLKGIRRKIGVWLMNRHAKRVRRDRKLSDFNAARRIGIIVTDTNPKYVAAAKNLLHYLQAKNIQCTLIGYFANNPVPSEFAYAKNNDFLSPKEIDFWGNPKGDLCYNFINSEFDILLNFNIQPNDVAEYLIALSRAHYKVGTYHQGFDYYDFTLDMTSNPSLDAFLDALKNYLGTLALRTE